MASLFYDVCQLRSNTTDNTSLRVWGNTVHNAFANSGWALDASWFTNGTGWSDITTSNTGANAVYATEIWHMTDSLQSTTPCYVSLTYSSYAYSGPLVFPTLTLAFGSRYNGNTFGNSVITATGLDGPVSTPIGIRPESAAANTTLYTSYFSGGNNYIILVLNVSQNYPIIISIERTHDAAGNDTSEGIIGIIAGCGFPSLSYTQFFWTPIGGMITEGSIGVALPQVLYGNSWPGGACGDRVQIFPIFPSRGIILNPMLNVVLTTSYVGTTYSPMTIPMYGSNHTYVMGKLFPSNFWGIRTQSAGTGFYAPAWRYE